MSIRYSDFGRKLVNDATKRNQQRIEECFKPTVEREAFFNGEFSNGDIVESENKTQEVIDVRSNYIVLIDESGQTKKKFTKDVCLSGRTMSYDSGTFKGVPISSPLVESIVAAYSSGKIDDTYAVVKCAKLFNENRIPELCESVKRFGIVELSESSEQLAVLQIIGNVLGIKGISDKNALIDQIKTKYKKLRLTPEQKKIFVDMVDLAGKRGIKIDLTESDDPNSTDNEEDIMGTAFKKQLKKHADLSPGFDDKKTTKHTKPGHSLSDNDSHRKMLVRQLKGLD